jgi:hypothetical protein
VEEVAAEVVAEAVAVTVAFQTNGLAPISSWFSRLRCVVQFGQACGLSSTRNAAKDPGSDEDGEVWDQYARARTRQHSKRIRWWRMQLPSQASSAEKWRAKIWRSDVHFP